MSLSLFYWKKSAIRVFENHFFVFEKFVKSLWILKRKTCTNPVYNYVESGYLHDSSIALLKERGVTCRIWGKVRVIQDWGCSILASVLSFRIPLWAGQCRNRANSHFARNILYTCTYTRKQLRLQNLTPLLSEHSSFNERTSCFRLPALHLESSSREKICGLLQRIHRPVQLFL